MRTDNSKNKQTFLEQMKALIASRMATRPAQLNAAFVDGYFRGFPLQDTRRETAVTFASMVVGQVEFIRRRESGELLLRVYNPSAEDDGWECRHTVIELVNEDKPFLVDSVSLALQELDLGIHLIVHPVLNVSRDAKGVLKKICPKSAPDTLAESFIHVQVDRQTDPGVLANIASKLKSRMAIVSVVVQDFQPMKRRLLDTIATFGENTPELRETVREECVEFLKWLADDHFMLIGARNYDIISEGETETLQLVEGSGLGLLREHGKTRLRRPVATLSGEARFNRNAPLIVTKTNARSPVHRSGYMDYIGVLQYDEDGRNIGEHRFIGLLTSNAYLSRATETPLIRMKVRTVLENAGFAPDSYAGKTLLHILETLPRDDVLQASSTELSVIANGVLDLLDRHGVRLFIRRERFGRFFSCLVYIPRDYFNTENREKIQRILKRALKGDRLDYVVQVSDLPLARLQVIVRPKAGETPDPDAQLLESKIIAALRSWNDELSKILVERFGEEVGLRWARDIGEHFPAAYMEDVSPWVASFDVEKVASLRDHDDLRLSLYRPRSRESSIIHFKTFRTRSSIPLSEVLPILENLGLHIVSERPYQLRYENQDSIWVQDFDMDYSLGGDLDIEVVRQRFQEAFENTWRGVTASDGFNRLILGCHLDWRQVKGIRAYCKYLLQTGITYSQQYMEETLARHPLMARLLVELFDAMFNPERCRESDYRRKKAAKQLHRTIFGLPGVQRCKDKVLLDYLERLISARAKDCDTQIEVLKKAFKRALFRVSSLDEDRILFSFYTAIRATLRTNFYKPAPSGELLEYMSFKLDSSRILDLPKPRPFREIWIFSSAVEGIHLRAGKVARGGLRWSDRREDFRTEVLGLMKAQNVKNTIIVPVGAKGGFVVKHLPEDGGRDEIIAEVTRCYKIFINGLLDITDNLDEDKVIPPEGVIRRDEDDPYLVVAADKGTASFSDTANAIALERGFWLGDAFASGGSVGYDHKGMGITARGAWEGIERHFREMGRNTRKEPFTVIGVGDMSGDVFGNGMLLSKKIRLLAAFNHQHIFLDPNPDEAESYRERKRLFALPRSGWDDYDRKLISRGGGVFSRLDKTIPLSKEVRAWLETDAVQLAPNELIRLLLKADVDLLWNGGIGTYVKSSMEDNSMVGDATNNGLRVNGNDLRCKVVGEGGNLGLTQLGRIEYAKAGGRINTDFIDNSAGVDCSDHEVNIKILLNQVMRAGELDIENRNRLLADMTDEVSRLVLRNNYMQTQTISMMECLTGERLGAKQHFIAVLEEKGILDRELERLPSDEELTQRRNNDEGLTRPELAVLLSYSKIMLYRLLLDSDVPEDPWFTDELRDYFPLPLRQEYVQHMASHRLKREIIATQVTNSVVNRMGASFVLRMCEDTSASAAEVARAYTIAREIFRARVFWKQVEALDDKVDPKLQNKALLAMWNLLRQATRWLLNQPGHHLDIKTSVEHLAPGMETLASNLMRSLRPDEKAAITAAAQPLIDGGMPKSLANKVSSLHQLYPALDVVETAARRQIDVKRVAAVFFSVGERLGLTWLLDSLESLPVLGQWHALARGNMREELYAQHHKLTARILEEFPDEKNPVASWVADNATDVEHTLKLFESMRRMESMDYATLSVAVRCLDQLLVETG